jgi:ABC-type Fe3+/spermidine/putrescine transport system ATPase subunit
MPRNPFVASFLGAANVLRGECRDREGVREVQVSFASFPVPSESPRGPCWVILRPEDLGIAIGKEAHFEAKVDGTAFMGASLRLQVQSSGERLALDVPNETGIQPGTVVRLRIHTHKVVVIPAGDHAHPHPLSPRSAAGPPQ